MPLPPDTDERALIARARAGDPAAFDLIFRAFHAQAISVAYGFLRNQADAEEVAMKVMSNVHRALPTFRGDSALWTWIHRITANLSRNRYWHRKRRGHGVTDSLDFVPEDSPSLHDTLAADTPGPLDATDLADLEIRIGAARLLLSRQHRQILELLVDRHLSYEELAAELGIGMGTVKSRIGRARECLRRHLERMGPTPAVSPIPRVRPQRVVAIAAPQPRPAPSVVRHDPGSAAPKRARGGQPGPRGFYPRSGKLDAIRSLIEACLTNREIQRQTGCHTGTIAKVRAHLQSRGQAFLCPCGLPATHRGWCHHRFAKSPLRQAVMRSMKRSKIGV